MTENGRGNPVARAAKKRQGIEQCGGQAEKEEAESPVPPGPEFLQRFEKPEGAPARPAKQSEEAGSGPAARCARRASLRFGRKERPARPGRERRPLPKGENGHGGSPPDFTEGKRTNPASPPAANMAPRPRIRSTATASPRRPGFPGRGRPGHHSKPENLGQGQRAGQPLAHGLADQIRGRRVPEPDRDPESSRQAVEADRACGQEADESQDDEADPRSSRRNPSLPGPGRDIPAGGG